MASRSQLSLALLDLDKEGELQGSTAANSKQQAGGMNLSTLACNVRRTTGQEPHSLVGSATAVLGDKSYVFGGRVLSKSHAGLTSDLYQLDLIRMHWSKIDVTGDIPAPRYFHSICALGDCKLICYGGMSAVSSDPSNGNNHDGQPEVTVMSDIHVLDLPSRTWSRIDAAGGSTPQGRYAHCATILPSSSFFTSPAESSIHTNGSGGSEMVVVGGQDCANHYIEQISVFNLRSCKWTDTSSADKSCGAYRTVVTPLLGMNASEVGSASPDPEVRSHPIMPSTVSGCPMLIYTNYNFVDVKLELQIRLPDGRLITKPMNGQPSPPGLRFPHGGIVNGNLVVSGTYLTSSKHEYALWSLDLRALVWRRIDAGGSIFGQGSWNLGLLWGRRSSFVIMGNCQRSLVEDYNHRRVNFSHVCVVELETFGLYNNPCRTTPTSSYVSYSSPLQSSSLRETQSRMTLGGRPMSSASRKLGTVAMSLVEMADMELQAVGGERLPVNSRVLSQRWGPYFNRLLRGSSDRALGRSSSPSSSLSSSSPQASLRRAKGASGYGNRISSITIRPSIDGSSGEVQMPSRSDRRWSLSSQGGVGPPYVHGVPVISRPRLLYLPHTYLTLEALVRYLYTESLPPPESPFCTPQILCSLLQIAQPYQVDGLLEATVERLHQVLDATNAAAVFNAAAMAAGGGWSTGVFRNMQTMLKPPQSRGEFHQASEDSVEESDGLRPSDMFGYSDVSDVENGRPTSSVDSVAERIRRETSRVRDSPALRVDPDAANPRNMPSGQETIAPGERSEESSRPTTPSTATSESTSTSTSMSQSDVEDGGANNSPSSRREGLGFGELSSVIGLQKRALRGLMEGRRLRERQGSTGGGSLHASRSSLEEQGSKEGEDG